MKLIGSQIRAWRSFRGLSQAELAQIANLPRPNLSALEQGRHDCTLSTLQRLARALKLSPAQLLEEAPLASFTLDRHEVDQIAHACFVKDASLPKKLSK